MRNYKKDQRLMEILKVQDLTYPICKTTKGELALMIRRNEEKYFYALDSIPVSEEIDAKLREIYENNKDS